VLANDLPCHSDAITINGRKFIKQIKFYSIRFDELVEFVPFSCPEFIFDFQLSALHWKE